MLRKYFLLTLILFSALLTNSRAPYTAAQVSSSTAYRIRRGTVLPTLCNPGDVFFLDTTPGSYQCLTTNNWSQFGAGGGGTPGGANKQVQINNSGVFDGAAGFEYQATGSPMVLMDGQTATDPVVVVRQSTASSTVPTVGGSPALFTTQLTNASIYWNQIWFNDAAPSNWATYVVNTGTLEFDNYTTGATLQGQLLFLETGIISAFTTNGGAYYFTKTAGVSNGGSLIQTATSEFHLAFGVSNDPSTHTKALTWTDVGVGINKTSAPGAQLHTVSGATTRIGEKIDSAANSTVDLLSYNLNADDTSTVANLGSFFANSNGVAAAGFGQSITFNLESSTTNDRNAARLSTLWTTATDGSRASAINFAIVDNAQALRDVISIQGNGADTGNSLNQLGLNGSETRRGILTEAITLSTVGATTDSTIDLPAGSIILGVTLRVTTTIAGVDSTTIQVGDPTTPTRFSSAISALTAGTTLNGRNAMRGSVTSDAAGPTQDATAKVRITLAGGADNTPSAGAVRITIHYTTLVPPTS